MKKVILPAALTIGVALLLISFVLPSLTSRKPTLGEEEYARLEELEDKIVDMYIQIERIKARTGGNEAPQERNIAMQQAIEERDVLKAKLEGGMQGPGTLATVLRYAGIAVLGIGVLGHFAMGESR